MPRKFEVRHIPVLPSQVLRALRPKPGQTLVDCTVGLGGHSKLLLERMSPGGRLIGFDFDQSNLDRAAANLKQTKDVTVTLHHSNFAAIAAKLAADNTGPVDGILADLGVASPQIDDPARGFSYRKPGPLDMRMDTTRAESAADLIARLSEQQLRDAFQEFGDEDDAPQIAELIVERRAQQPITTTQDLTEIICTARDFTLQRAAGAKLHPAARTFQALRMLVNREPQNLDRLLAVAPQILKPGGTIAIISFHSGEDRRVKQAFREAKRDCQYSEVSEDAEMADLSEQRQNPRSRTAKLRWARTPK